MTKDLKPSLQCLKAAASAQRILNMIRLSFRHLDIASLSQIYKTIVRPRLEFCIPAWCPYLQKDICVLEKVQRRATRIFPQLRGLSYRDRLAHFHLTSLKTRRLRFDLLTAFKVLRGFTDLSPDTFFSPATCSITRGHSMKLTVHFSRLSCRRSFFSQRVVEWWNRLPEDCVSAPSVSSFKFRLDLFLKHSDLW